MKTSKLVLAVLGTSLLGGCAVYGPASPYYSQPGYYGPPVQFGLDLGYWHGDGWHRHHDGWHDGGGRGGGHWR